MTEATKHLRKGSVLVVGVGASRGLGAAIARRFAAGGYPVIVAGRNAAKIQTVVDELKRICNTSESMASGLDGLSKSFQAIVEPADSVPLL